MLEPFGRLIARRSDTNSTIPANAMNEQQYSTSVRATTG